MKKVISRRKTKVNTILDNLSKKLNLKTLKRNEKELETSIMHLLIQCWNLKMEVMIIQI